jgi:hypothetical protein
VSGIATPRGAARLDAPAAAAGAAAVALLAAAIAAGSRGLRDYDLALLPYTIGVLVAAFAAAYRYALWLRRPPTALYWRRAWPLLRGRGGAAFAARFAWESFLTQRFVRRRGRGRWLAHLALAWGTLLAGAVTFPLVFGWLHFEARPDDPAWYRVVAVGQVLAEFHTASAARYVLFNLLNLAAVMVIAGALLALRRRLRDPGARAAQRFVQDLLPLLLLLAVSITGLTLTFSAHLLGGRGYAPLSLIHALVVGGTLIYLPFGTLFHVVQRPAHLAVALYRRAGAAGAPATCTSCGEAYASAMHVADLKVVLAEVGQDWSVGGPVEHYAHVCPRCRRRLLGFTQGRLPGRAGAA